ncbi:MAG: ABC transporter [Paenibacillaceae bacterium ZCTH02-B3]|nr:MAG: ABC transporter [Paenibacillaceae bacterium ZCTH02-B3]
MRFLRPYVRRHGAWFMASILCLTLEAAVDLMQPALLARIVDEGVAYLDLRRVLGLGGIMLLLTAAGALAATARNVISSRVSQRFGKELRADMYRRIQSMPLASLDRFDRASLVTRITNDVTQVQNFVNGLMRIFVKAPLVCVGALIMAASLNLYLASVLAAVVPVVLLLLALNMKYGFPLFQRVQRAMDRVNGAMREYLAGVRVVKAFNRFSYETEKFDRANAELQQATTRALRTMALFNPAVMLTVNLGLVAVLWIGGWGVRTGRVQVGETMAFLSYMTQILFSLMMIFMVFAMFVRARTSALRIGEVFAAGDGAEMLAGVTGPTVAPEPAGPAVAAGPAGGTAAKSEAGTQAAAGGRIDFERVTFRYPSDEGNDGLPALREVTFTCLPGETVGIIGPTGSGKSTLVSLLLRLYDVTSGAVKVDGTDVRSMDPRILRASIACVTQDASLFTGTIADNIRMGKEDATMEEIAEAARLAQARDFIEAFPEKYETRLGQRGVNLSGGQKQRIALARALVRRPRILVLDDAMSALDAVTESRVREALKSLGQGVTRILIAQKIATVMDADKIIVLDHGEVAGIGAHEVLLRSCPLYREICETQLGKEALSHV